MRPFLRSLIAIAAALLVENGAGKPANVAAQAQAHPDPRLYIHLQNAGQKPAGEALRRALSGARIGSRPLSVRPLVVDSGPDITTTQLRCTTPTACGGIVELAGLLEPLIGSRPRLVRLSNSGADRLNHYEVWFGAAPLQVAGFSPPDASTTGAGGNRVPNQAPNAPDHIAEPLQHLTFQMSMTRPQTIAENDVVALGFSLPGGANLNYAVTIDGVAAPLRQTPSGLEVTVPTVEHALFSRRTVPLVLKINGRWRVAPSPYVVVASRLEQSMVWIMLLAGLGATGLLIWKYQRLWRKEPVFFDEAKAQPRIDAAGPAPAVNLLPGQAVVLAEPPEALVEACAHGEGLLFLGGDGESVTGLTSHSAVLRNVLNDATEVPPELKAESRLLRQRGDLDTVVDLLAERMGREALIAALDQHYAQIPTPPDFARLLREIGFSAAITSGFTRAIEGTWPKALHLTLRTPYDFAALVAEKQPFVLKLRGDLAEPSTVFLTGLELGRALDETPNLRSVLSALFASRLVLFAGMGADTLSTALATAGIRSASGRRHFALVQDGPGFDISADRFLRQYGIEFIRIASGDDIAAFFGRLAARVADFQKSPLAKTAGEASAADQATITHVHLRNIGPFTDVEVEFRKPWTMLLGNNGAGKSTILRAIALALSGDDSLVLEPGRPLLRRGASEGSIELTVSTGRTPIRYCSNLSMVQGRLAISANTAPLQSGTLTAFGFPAMRGAIAAGTVDLSRDDSFPKPRVADVLPIIAGGVDDRGRNLKQWIFRTYLRSLETKLPEADRVRSRAMIDSLFQVIDSMTPGFQLRFSRCDPDSNEILLQTSDGEVPMDYISQGMSATIGWIGPIIQRLYEINGAESLPKQQRAILLIDEIDSHLHPAWQQKLVDSLKEHFPNVQVIATTHSPLMVGNLAENEVLRVVRGEGGLSIDYLEQSFIGFRFDQILTDEAFGLPRARAGKWTAREDYIALFGKTNRTPKEEAELARLEAELERLPGAAETPAERRAVERSERVLKDALLAAAKAVSDKGDANGGGGGATA